MLFVAWSLQEARLVKLGYLTTTKSTLLSLLCYKAAWHANCIIQKQNRASAWLAKAMLADNMKRQRRKIEKQAHFNVAHTWFAETRRLICHMVW